MPPSTMAAARLTGHCGLDKLEYRADVVVPQPDSDEVLIRVAAAGVNNTDINTRIGWYSKAVRADTGAGGRAGFDTADHVKATWSGEPLQFPRIQGATVTAICSPAKAAGVAAQGADHTLDRTEDVSSAVGRASVDVVIDLVGGPQSSRLLDTLRAGGRYAVSGAIGGPFTEIDLRTLYLKDLSMFGCTFQEDAVFANLVGYVERDEVQPVVSRTYPLAQITQAQQDFLDKQHLGKLVLLPPER